MTNMWKYVLQKNSENTYLAIAAASTSFINKIFDVFPEILISQAINVVLGSPHRFLIYAGFTETMAQLIFLGVGAFVIWFLESGFEYAQALYWRAYSQSLQGNLRNAIFDHVQRAAVKDIYKYDSNDITATLNQDVSLLEQFLDTGPHEIIHLLTGSLIIGGMFFYLAPGVAIIACTPIPFILGISLWFRRYLRPLYVHLRDTSADVSSFINSAIKGIITIKSFTQEDATLHTITQKSEALRDAQFKAALLSCFFIPFIRIIIAFGLLGTIILGGYYAINGWLSVGSYSLFIIQTQRLLWPLTRIGLITDQYERSTAALVRIVRFLELPREESYAKNRLGETAPEKMHVLMREDFARVLYFEHVYFNYHKNALPALKDISFEIPPRSMCAFVGSTGSGKSTIAHLIARLIEPTQGSIMLGNHNLSTINIQSLRRHIILISQEPTLFKGSIRDNIMYGLKRAVSHEICKNASDIAQIRDFIEKLPNQYDTLLDEYQSNLSGGQKQRIALARAFTRDCSMLILDEATSAVDVRTEAYIYQNIRRLERRPTMIVISHRLQGMRFMDKIFVVDKGTIIESGKHDELLEQKGTYYTMWQSSVTGESIFES